MQDARRRETLPSKFFVPQTSPRFVLPTPAEAERNGLMADLMKTVKTNKRDAAAATRVRDLGERLGLFFKLRDEAAGVEGPRAELPGVHPDDRGPVIRETLDLAQDDPGRVATVLAERTAVHARFRTALKTSAHLGLQLRPVFKAARVPEVAGKSWILATLLDMSGGPQAAGAAFLRVSRQTFAEAVARAERALRPGGRLTVAEDLVRQHINVWPLTTDDYDALVGPERRSVKAAPTRFSAIRIKRLRPE